MIKSKINFNINLFTLNSFLEPALVVAVTINFLFSSTKIAKKKKEENTSFGSKLEITLVIIIIMIKNLKHVRVLIGYM